MAINWTVAITAVNVDTGRADVSAVRTDTEKPDNKKTYLLSNTPLATADERAWALTTIKGWVEQDTVRTATVNAWLRGLEQTAKVDLESWEVTR